MKRVIAWLLAIFVFAVFVLFRLDFALTHPRHDRDFAIPIQTGSAWATEPFAQVRTYAMSWMALPRGVRNIGMGATGTADVSGLSNGYFNPATMAFSNVTRVGGSYEEIGVADIKLSEITLSAPIPFRADSTAGEWQFSGSFGYARLDMEPQTERTIFLPEGTGKTFDASDWALSALGATSWSRGVTTLAAGATGKYLKSNLAAAEATVWALDVGALAAFPIYVDDALFRPRMGYSLLNLDSGASYDGRESNIENRQRVGLGFDVATSPVVAWGRAVPLAALSLDYDLVNREWESDWRDSAGFEITLVDVAHFRYGAIDNDFTTYGFGLGWDYGNVLFNVDYAHQDMENWFSVDRDTFGALVGVRW